LKTKRSDLLLNISEHLICDLLTVELTQKRGKIVFATIPLHEKNIVKP